MKMKLLCMLADLMSVQFFLIALLIIAARRDCVKVVPISPIKCPGVYIPYAVSKEFPAIYLCRGQQLEVVAMEDFSGDDAKSFLVCDILPLIVSEDYSISFSRRHVYSRKECKNSTLWAVDNQYNIINKDNGLYDNLPYADTKWFPERNAKKFLYDSIMTQPAAQKQQQVKSIRDILLKRWGIAIVGLILEEDDRFSVNSVSIGAAAVLMRLADINQRISSQDFKKIASSLFATNRQASASDFENIFLSQCHLDECVELSLSLDIPIYTSAALFEGLSLDGTLTRQNEKEGMKITAKSIDTGKSSFNEESDDIVPAWEIFDPRKFLSMTALQKRATLRKSGVEVLPRPRQGIEKLDDMLLDLMDDAVRGEVIRIRANQQLTQDGSVQNLAIGPSSARQILLSEMAIALEQGNMDRAETLRLKFAKMTALRADPTQPVGSYDPYLDQDDWYMEARRKSMRP